MPVLDAKALDLDPKGAAFLLSVLRQNYLPKAPSKDSPRIGRVHFHYRLVRRPKELLVDNV